LSAISGPSKSRIPIYGVNEPGRLGNDSRGSDVVLEYGFPYAMLFRLQAARQKKKAGPSRAKMTAFSGLGFGWVRWDSKAGTAVFQADDTMMAAW
jgi:hypothetical protein